MHADPDSLFLDDAEASEWHHQQECEHRQQIEERTADWQQVIADDPAYHEWLDSIDSTDKETNR